LWSDRGGLERIVETLARIGRLHELAFRLAKRGHDPEEVLRSHQGRVGGWCLWKEVRTDVGII